MREKLNQFLCSKRKQAQIGSIETASAEHLDTTLFSCIAGVYAVVEVNVARLFLRRRQSEVAGRSTRPNHCATLLQVQLLGICPRVVLFDALPVTNLYKFGQKRLRANGSIAVHYMYNKTYLQATSGGRHKHQVCNIFLFTEACPRPSTAPPKLRCGHRSGHLRYLHQEGVPKTFHLSPESFLRD